MFDKRKTEEIPAVVAQPEAADVADALVPQAVPQVSQQRVDAAKATIDAIVGSIDSVIQGKHDVVELVVLALIARGHVLLEDLPGTGKTTLISTLAKSVDCGFSRIQFTPDVMPSDVSGFSIYNQKTQEFDYRPGGVMSNLVLADEINRASAKTQSALLEAMEERQVTVDGITRKLEEPFMVLATQNPIEQFGTYPLPEAQLDRFMIKASMGYPGFTQEFQVLKLGDSAKQAVHAVASGADVLEVREAAKEVYAADMVIRYIVQIITATRDNTEVQVGSSPRGGIALLALARAFALARGRGYVLPDDVKTLAPHVLRHRLALTHEAKTNARTPDMVIASILGGIEVPHIEESELAQGK
ncbi:MAG: AAA family ATPase [Coriobacteriia bacterium]|nr:AAA family ATPase [Coriobacteriia bacterium]